MPRKTSKEVENAANLVENSDTTIAQAAKNWGISRQALYNHLRKRGVRGRNAPNELARLRTENKQLRDILVTVLIRSWETFR